MKTVYLYGRLAEICGDKLMLDVKTTSEVMMALRANFPEVDAEIIKGWYRVVLGKSLDDGIELEASSFHSLALGDQDMFIVPVVDGAKRGGVLKAIAGIALIGLSAMTGGAVGALMSSQIWGGATIATTVNGIGTSLLLTGAASMISPQNESKEDTKSFTMSGPQGSMREGGIIPIVYGEVYTSGVMISGGLSIVVRDADDAVEEPSSIFS